MKICLVCHEYPPERHGGIGTVTKLLAEAMVRAGHGVRVIGIYKRGCTKRENVAGVDVWRQKAFPLSKAWAFDRMRLYWKVRRSASHGEIALVEVPDWGGSAAFWPALPIPVLTRLHGSATYFAHELGHRVPRLTRTLEQRSCRRAEFVAGTSEYVSRVTDSLFGLGRRLAGVVYNGVELPVSIKPFQQRSRTEVVFAGSLSERKGIVSLIDAWPAVLQAFPQATLHFYGGDGKSPTGGRMSDYLGARLPESIRKAVTFRGNVERNEVATAFSRARVAVFPSYAEAFAMVPMEAMANGCPTIYSTRGSGSELIVHGRDGLLVDPSQPQEIANAIARLLANDQEAAAFADAGRKRIEACFSEELFVTQTISLYELCLKGWPVGKTYHRNAVGHHVHFSE